MLEEIDRGQSAQQNNESSPEEAVTSTPNMSKLENIVKTVCSTQKLLKLYPPNNPIPEQALEKLYLMLNDFLEKEGELRIKITKNFLIMDDQPIGKDNETIANFAAELYNRNLSQIALYYGLTKDEIADFLTIIGLEADFIRSHGGVDTLLWEKEVSNISIEETARKIIDVEPGPDAGPAGGQTEEVVSAPDVKMIESLLERASPSSPGQWQILTRLVSQPQEVNRYLIGLSRLLTDKTGEAGLAYRINQLNWSLEKLNNVVLQEEPGVRPALYRNIAEAILSLDEQTKLKLFREKIFPHAVGNSMAANLIAQLSPAELAVNITQALTQDASHSEETINHLKKVSSLSRETKNEIFEMLQKQLGTASPWLEELSFLKESAEKAESQETMKALEEPPKSSAIHISELAEELVSFSPEEFEAITQTGLAISQHSAAMTTVNTLLDMLALEERLINFSQTISLLVDITTSLLEHQEFTLAVRVVRALREQSNIKSDYTPKYKERIDLALQELGSTQKIRKLIEALRTLKKESEEVKNIHSYLTLLDRKVVLSSLLEILATEKEISTRKLVSGILINLGRHDVSILGRKISDTRWFFVRNIVEILGLIGSDEALPYLDTTIKHEDARVRKETIRALGLIGGEKSLDMLLASIEDRDVSIRQMVAKWIGSTRNPRAIAPLIKIVQNRDLFLKNYVLKKYAIESLGLIGSNEALPVLKKVLSRKPWFQKAKHNELKASAIEALRQIGSPEAQEILTSFGEPI